MSSSWVCLRRQLLGRAGIGNLLGGEHRERNIGPELFPPFSYRNKRRKKKHQEEASSLGERRAVSNPDNDTSEMVWDPAQGKKKHQRESIVG